MAEDSFAMGYAMGQDSGGGNSMFNGDGFWGIILLALLFGGGGFGYGGFGGGYGGQALTRAELYDGFATQNIDSAVRNVQNGISDATYALTGTITNGFHGVDSALCNVGHQISDCCCATQQTIQSGIQSVIDNQNANYRGIMDFMVQEKLASKDARIAELTNQVSQLNQNAVFGARIDAAVAEIIRKTGNECPTPAYWVSPPTPVQVPYNGGCGCGF